MNSQTTAAKVQTLTAATIIPKNALGNSQVMIEVGAPHTLSRRAGDNARSRLCERL